MEKITMPHNADFERAVLSSMLILEDDRATILQRLKAVDYYLSAHREIFQSISNLDFKGLAPEPSLIDAEIKSRGSAVDPMLINEILDREPIAINLEYYIETLKDLALKRRLAEIGNVIFKKAVNGEDLSGRGVHDYALQKIIDLGACNDVENESLSNTLCEIVSGIEDNASAMGKIPGVPTGFYDLDDLIGGLKPCNMYVIAARPGRGKSALAENIAVNAALGGVRVQIFSMEMSRQQLAVRWLAAESEIDLKRIEHFQLSDSDKIKINDAARKLYKLGIDIYDRGGLSNLDLEQLCRQFKARNNIGLVIVDYLQLASGQHPKNPVKDTGDVSKSLKRIAQNLRIPVIGISQLSREAAKVQMPQTHHLRESGDIEQDADVIIMLSTWDKEGSAGVRELNVAKQRQGPEGTIRLSWVKEFTQFLNLYEG